MTGDDVRAVLASLDLERLAAIARQGPEPVFATISGAHLYGFASPDSDVDLRGAFRLPLRSVVRAGAEALTLGADELPRHEADLDALERRLTEAHAESRLPDEPTSRRELEDLVIRLRLAR